MPGEDDIVRDVTTFFQNFIESFNRRDTELYRRSLRYLNTIFSAEQGLIMDTQCRVARIVQSVR